MSLPQVALVVWHDHHCSDQPITREDAAKLRPMKRMAVGWVMANTDAGITLAMDIGAEYPDEGDPHLFLARDMVEEVLPLHAGPVLGDED